MANESRKTPHAQTRRRAMERQQPRRSKRTTDEHVDKYSTKTWENSLAALVDHFQSEEAASRG